MSKKQSKREKPSGYAQLVQAIMDQHGQRDQQVEDFNRGMGTPGALFTVGTGEGQQVWGVWRDPSDPSPIPDLLKVRRRKDGRYDPFSVARVTREELAALVLVASPRVDVRKVLAAIVQFQNAVYSDAYDRVGMAARRSADRVNRAFRKLFEVMMGRLPTREELDTFRKKAS